ncbi:MAG TPA: T9SS type A sorting domain-containing protein [Candidatus Cloacimonetes bacterium]|nr:T9SS type A sorting domain-containing protein [Candidatus Cloacimonadota bacterium]
MKSIYLIVVLLAFSTMLCSMIIDVPDDYPTIQQGIDAAADTDTVLVADGIYDENINFLGKAITVASNFLIDADESHIENTIINGSTPINPDFGSVVTFMSYEDTTSVITGFTLTEGTGFYRTSSNTRVGGGIICDNSSPKIISNITTNNTADYGGGINIYENCNAYLEGNIISNNTSFINSGGVNIVYSSPTLINNIISGNSANQQGAGISAWDSSPVLINNIISYNTAGTDISGLAIASGGTTTIQNCLIYGNSAGGSVGGILVQDSEAEITNCVISGNSATAGDGIYLFDNSTLDLTNTIITGNEGEGINFDGQHNVNIQYCDFHDNQNDFTGNVPPGLGVITGYNQYGTPCDVFVNIFEDPLFTGNIEDPFSLSFLSPCIDSGIQDTTGLNLPPFDIIGNDRITDGRGDGFAFIDMGAYEFPGYGMYIDVPEECQTIQAGIDAAVNGNTVLVAEGTYFENINFTGKLITVASNFLIDGDESHIENTIINGSQPINTDYGSVVTFMSYEDTTSVLTGFTLTEGLGNDVPGIGTVGGGIFVDSSSPSIISNIITNNSADHIGGLHCMNDSNPRIINNVITNNFGIIEIGGLAFAFDSDAYVEGNIIRANTDLGTLSNGAGGITLNSSSPTFINNIIMDNHADDSAGGIYMCLNSCPVFINCIISGNTTNEIGGGLKINNSNITMINTIMEGNEAVEGAGIYFDQPGNVDIQYCDFYNGGNDFGGNVQPGLGDYSYVNQYGTPCDEFFNISEDPLFVGTGDHPLSLLEYSPCIDAGDATGLNLPLYDIIGNDRIVDGRGDGFVFIDMGAYEFEPDSIGVDDENIQYSKEKIQLSNYPNPFHSSTTISFSTTEHTENLEIGIYNVKGQKVKTFENLECINHVNAKSTQSLYSITWNGKDDNNKPVQSGVYFYKLKSGEREKTKRMLIMR